jgi:uncharacterized protein (DUF302 family)
MFVPVDDVRRMETMKYFLSREVDAPYEETLERVAASLKEQGFGILTEIDVKTTLKKKLDVDFRKYKILGACNPPLAHAALQEEDKIGVLLPCNVIVQEREGGGVEVAAMDPAAFMNAVGNPALEKIAEEARGRLNAALEKL